MICFAASWWGEEKIEWYGEYETDHEEMLDAAWQLVDEADVVCHYNGRKFDIPTLNKEFLLWDFTPPSPYQQIDLLEVMRRCFRFPSNKLEYIAEVLTTETKVKHSGHQLWIRCMNRDPEAWQEMEVYNKQDVNLLKEIYPRVLPWIINHPSISLYDSEPEASDCPRCGANAEKMIKQGFSYTSVGKYQRYKCGSCGGWSQGNKRIERVEVRSM